MSLALVAIVVAIGVGAVVAVSTREPAAAPIGLAVALVAAALLADPLPSATILGVRILAALLAATLIRWAGRAGSRGAARQPSPLGWPSEALLATAGTIAGVGVALGLASIGLAYPGAGPIDGPIDGPIVGPGFGVPTGEAAVTAMALTVGAAACLFVLGAAPAVQGQPGIRGAIGLVLLAQGVILLRLGIAGPAPVLEEVAWAGLLVACAATGAALARAAAEARDLPEPPSADLRGRGLAHR